MNDALEPLADLPWGDSVRDTRGFIQYQSVKIRVPDFSHQPNRLTSRRY